VDSAERTALQMKELIQFQLFIRFCHSLTPSRVLLNRSYAPALRRDATQKQKAEWWLGFHPALQWQRRWKPHSRALRQAPSRTRQWKLFARTQFPHAASNLPHDHAAHNTTASRFAPPAPLFTFVCSICRDVLLLPVP
jgi:hypothetical protein